MNLGKDICPEVSSLHLAFALTWHLIFATMVQSVAGDYNKLRWHFTPRRSPVYSLLLLLLFFLGGVEVGGGGGSTLSPIDHNGSDYKDKQQ